MTAFLPALRPAPVSTSRRRSARRMLLLLVTATVVTLIPPVHAAGLGAPFGPDSLKQPAPIDRLELTEQCNPDGFSYEIFYSHPNNAPVAYLGSWRPAGQGAGGTPVNGKAGFVPSGAGDFEFRATVVLPNGPVVLFDSGWVDVSVFCPGFVPVPKGEPVAGVDVVAVCEPEAGFDYLVSIKHAPAGPLAFRLQWRTEPQGPVQQENGSDGFVASGEGSFQVRGVVHYQGPGFYASPWTKVTVDCTELPPADVPEGNPGGGSDTDIRPGRPTFTG